MSPPYTLIDQATGKPVTTADGKSFTDMDTSPGNTVEVYAGGVATGPTARMSPGAAIRPPDGSGPTPPDPPDPIPDPGADMDYPKNENDFANLLQSYADNQYVGQLDPRTKITQTKPIVITQKNSDGGPWGVNGNGARILWKGSGGQDMITYAGVQSVNNRGLTLKNLYLDGNGYAAAPAGACIKISAPLGDNGPIYGFFFENLYSGYATNGLFLEGGVYEGTIINVHAENHASDGVFMQNLPNGAIVSNVSMISPNCSRNFGAGIHSVYSVDIFGGSFVLNALGGVVAPAGLRSASQCNGENTGEAVFVIGSMGGYGTAIYASEASSDGVTVARKYQNGNWVNVGKPELYLINWSDGTGAGCVQQMNHCSYYGSGSNPMRVVK